MPVASTRPLRLLRVAFGVPEVPDRDLLARFVSSRDEEAFAELVRRHGPMVLAVCRRVTGRTHDAEDAFQAAFLVLARRAAHVARPELLANRLYGVACRTALEARAARRRAEEHVVPAAPEPVAPPTPDDTAELRKIIDEELAKLPDKYRTAVVLCDLEGLPRAAAAQRMGIPEGTLSSRLAHARKVLAERLARRGVTATVTALIAALARDASAAVLPNTLTNLTVHAAARFALGGTSLLGVSPSVSSLTDGVLKTMLASRLRQLFGIGLLACGLVGVGATFAQQLAPPAPTESTEPPVIANDGLRYGFADAQPKVAEPKKVPAKGIEDDDVPYGSFPSQAAVRVEDGKLIVRQRAQTIEAVPVKNFNGQTVVMTQRKSGVQATTHDVADVSVYDMKGNRLSTKAWKEMFKNDVHVLIASDGKVPNPRELTLFKADTVLVVLPAPPAPAYTPATSGPYYVPSGVQPAKPLPGSSTVPAQPVPYKTVPQPPTGTIQPTVPQPLPSRNEELPPMESFPAPAPK